MRLCYSLLWLMFLLPPLEGCGAAVSEEELGEIRYELPAVPGAAQPYQLPELGTAQGESQKQVHAEPH